MEQFDFVIVGSGPAGSLLAKRLTEESDCTACVLEAGGKDRNPYIHIPAGFVKTLHGGNFKWDYRTEPAPATLGRSINIPQGRVVGGSSSINGLVYSRGHHTDFDAWQALGNPGWSYREVLPYFRRSERRVGQADPVYRGLTGELPITDPDWRSPLCDAFIDGVVEQGVPRNQDYNGEVQEGVGYFQRYIERGRRISAATAFLYPAVAAGRVELRPNAEAIAIILRQRKAVGVRYQNGDGTVVEVFARREVLVCAGTINSPKLLQLSGIGPGTRLRELGIPLVQDLPGVGENLQDHYTVRLTARARNVRTLNEYGRGGALALQVLNWLMGRPSVLALSPSLVYVYWQSAPGLGAGDFQVLFTPGSYKTGKAYVFDTRPGMTCGARQQRPESRGYVRLRSADPGDPPILQPNYLSSPRDQEAIVSALRWARRFMRSAALAPYFDRELIPGSHVATEGEWLDFARQAGSTAYHLVGTCRMAPRSDPTALVDHRLKVHGIDALRVVDASVMPTIPAANTLAATLMIAEKAADLIRDRPPLAPAVLDAGQSGLASHPENAGVPNA